MDKNENLVAAGKATILKDLDAKVRFSKFLNPTAFHLLNRFLIIYLLKLILIILNIVLINYFNK